MRSLIGNTGFVGSNLLENGDFDAVYNSKNVKNAYGTNPEVLIYAGVTGTKYLANLYPEQDKQIIEAAKKNILEICPQKLVLISTVDVNSRLDDVDEDSAISAEGLHTYGRNRYELEEWVKEHIQDYHIIRLPAIYGKNLKKNFIYDMIHPVPQKLSMELFHNAICLNADIKNFYIPWNEQFMILKELNVEEKIRAERIFENFAINSLIFTDCYSKYQFYNLANLREHMELAISHNIRILNLCTEPLAAFEVYEKVFHHKFNNQKPENRISYNLRTKYDTIFGGNNGYILSKEDELYDLEKFIIRELENKREGKE